MTDGSRRYLGLSLGHPGVREAQRWLDELPLPADTEACLHHVPLPYPHVAVSISVAAGTRLALPPIPAGLGPAAARAASAHAAGRYDSVLRPRAAA